MPPLTLNRMAIEEAGPNPRRMAEAIHGQLGALNGPAPIQEIARALDIEEIRQVSPKGFEAALVTGPERDVGGILVNANSPARRRKFSIGHELGHFLNPWHRSLDADGGFACRIEDILGSWRSSSRELQRHLVQEREANRFAIELLAPRKCFRPFLARIPDLAIVLRLADQLDLSKEACARRYVELHEQPTALVFSYNGVVRYVERCDKFPFVNCRPKEPLPSVPPPEDDVGLSAHVEADARDWLARPTHGGLVIQTLSQSAGYAITLLALDLIETDDNGEI